MLVRFLGLLVIILVGILGANNIQSQSNELSISSPADLTEEIFLHPAGPTTRREWRQKSSSVLYRIEIDRSRSGQIVFDGLSLIYNSKSGWSLVNAQQKSIIRITPNDIASKKLLHFKVGDQQWDMMVRGEEVPISRAGIATETENSIDITFSRSK
jgi:hypothetical protein